MALFIILFCAIFVYLFLRHKNVRDKCSYLPGPKGYPFIGSGLEIAMGSPEDFFTKLCSYDKLYGYRVRVVMVEDLIIGLGNPEDIEVVMTNPQFLEKSREYVYLRPWLGNGLLLSGGDKWRKHRKVITPAFHFKILNNFIQVFDSQSEIFIEKLRRQADSKGDEFDINSFITMYALDTLCETAMGVQMNAQQNSASAYVNAVHNALNLAIKRIRHPFKRIDFFYQFTKDYKEMSKTLDILHDFTNSMIKQRKFILEKSNETLSTYTGDVYGAKKNMAFLDILLLSTIDGTPLSDVDIREEVDTFLFEGHDTTSSAIGFAIYLLSKNPHIQEKVYKEQMEIFSDKKLTPLTHSDLHSMKYLDLVIKETLRLYPSVPFLGRKVLEDAMINDMRIPKDTTILIGVYSMGRNPAVFPNPNEFIPERFLPEECIKRNPFTTVFFSAGSRNCIGQKFAMLVMKTTLSKLVRNFIIGASSRAPILTGDFILKSVNGINVKLTPRPTTMHDFKDTNL